MKRTAPETRCFDDYAVLIDLIRANLDALSEFVDTYATTGPQDTSPEQRRRLVEVEDLLEQALDHFS
jgi:hypothetical protein